MSNDVNKTAAISRIEEEKATGQLSGRVKESQKEEFSEVVGETFSDKIGSLLKAYGQRIDTTKFNITSNKNAIIDAFEVVLNNLGNIEMNVDAFIKSKEITDTRSEVEYLTTRLNNTIKDYVELGKENKNLKEQIRELEKEAEDTANLKEENRLLLIKYSSLLEKKGDA